VSPGCEEALDVAEGGLGSELALPDPLRLEVARVDREVAALAGGPATDGRLARGRRTRRNVAEALVALLTAGDPDPTAKAVAAQAGVSLRLVFHHFADMDDLYHFVAALQLRRQWSDMPQLSPGLSRSSRIERTVAHRAVLFEEISPVRRALVRRAPTSLGVAQALAASDHLLVENVRATFAPELATLPTGARAEQLGALDTASSWPVWERLRTSSDAGVRTARRVVTHMLDALSARPAGGDVARALDDEDNEDDEDAGNTVTDAAPAAP
jgi:TetR/AcrR family transcriptional regulator, regulator of autoinduction and epiphytic fitness